MSYLRITELIAEWAIVGAALDRGTGVIKLDLLCKRKIMDHAAIVYQVVLESEDARSD